MPAAALFAVLLIIASTSLRLFGVEYPLLIDLPNHLARHAIQCSGDQPGGLNDYYQFQLRVVPNLAADLVYALDLACRDIYLTSRILIQVSILNLVASVFALHYALWRRLSLWPAMSALLVYNLSFSYGFENYVLAAPFALYGFSAWIALSENRPSARLVIMVPFAMGLYLLHMLVFGFLIILIFGWDLQEAISALRSGIARATVIARRLAQSVAVAMPAAGHFLYVILTSPPDASTHFDYGSLAVRMDMLFSLTMPWHWGWVKGSDFALHSTTIVFMAAVIIWGYLGGKLRFDRRLAWPLIICLVVILAIPWNFAGVAYSHVRYPYLAVAVLIAALDWRSTPRTEAALIVAVLTLFYVRTETALRNWTEHDREVRELLAGTSQLPAGARLLPTYSSRDRYAVRHANSIAYIALDYDVFIPSLFNGANPLAPRPAYRDWVSPQEQMPRLDQLVDEIEANRQGTISAFGRGRYWANWPAKFTHILHLGRPGKRFDAINGLGTMAASGESFALYQVSDGN